MSKKISLNKVLALGATSTALFSGAMMMNNNKVEASSSSIVLLKFKRNAYRYNKNGKRIGTGYITKGSTYYSKGAYRIHGKKYHKLDTKGNIYIKDGNLSIRRLTNQVTLKHNAYIYNIHGRRINRQKLYKGVSYFIYGSRYINGKKYYQIGAQEYIKASNASAPFSTYGQSSNNDVDNTTNNSNVSNNSATNTSTTTQTNTNTNVGSNTSSNNSSVTNNQSASNNSSSSANTNIQLPNNSSQSNNTGNQGSTTKPSTGNSGSQNTKPNTGNNGGQTTKPSTGNSGSQATKPATGNNGGQTTKPSTGNNGSQVTKPNTGNQGQETQPSQPTYSKNYVKLPAGYLETVKNANWEKTSVPDDLIRKGAEMNNFHSESKADDDMKINSERLTPAQELEINDFALRLINNVRLQNNQNPWYYTQESQHVANRVAYLYEQDHMGLSTWHDDKALNQVDSEFGIHTAELMGGDNVNYKEDYLHTMTDLKHAVYNDVVGMLFSTVELRHAQIMLTYNSIDHPETTYFGLSVSWQEHNKDGRQEHSDHFIAY